MTKKRKFNNNAVDKFFTSDIEEQDTQEKQEEQGEQKPTNIRGQKLPRINIAFTHQNLDYLQRISTIEGISITQYVNNLIQADIAVRIEGLEEAEKAFKKAQEILKGV